MQILAGTSGFSYKEWRGSFYPQDLSDKQMLSYYAGQLPTVEINNTFYRMPKTAVLRSWAEQAGGSFLFVIKATRRITHIKRLREVSEESGYLLITTQTVGAR